MEARELSFHVHAVVKRTWDDGSNNLMPMLAKWTVSNCALNMIT